MHNKEDRQYWSDLDRRRTLIKRVCSLLLCIEQNLYYRTSLLDATISNSYSSHFIHLYWQATHFFDCKIYLITLCTNLTGTLGAKFWLLFLCVGQHDIEQHLPSCGNACMDTLRRGCEIRHGTNKPLNLGAIMARARKKAEGPGAHSILPSPCIYTSIGA